jgi:hypothetical protein
MRGLFRGRREAHTRGSLEKPIKAWKAWEVYKNIQVPWLPLFQPSWILVVFRILFITYRKAEGRKA